MYEANIPMQATIFRCGWEKNSLHITLSYVFTSMSNETRCKNTVAHWLYNMYIEIYSGVPPTLDDIQT